MRSRQIAQSLQSSRAASSMTANLIGHPNLIVVPRGWQGEKGQGETVPAVLHKIHQNQKNRNENK
jgi:hypothetical protein